MNSEHQKHWLAVGLVIIALAFFYHALESAIKSHSIHMENSASSKRITTAPSQIIHHFLMEHSANPIRIVTLEEQARFPRTYFSGIFESDGAENSFQTSVEPFIADTLPTKDPRVLHSWRVYNGWILCELTVNNRVLRKNDICHSKPVK
jgi:hypothetical protein